jgi:hypothetical protein
MKPCSAARHLLLLALLAVGPIQLAAAADVRVLIDVSGSMRKTDPANLRVPALKLLAKLLPTGTTAGVWLFDQEAEELLPPATVDDAWKDLARGHAYRIHSRGRFTNIEAALDAASADWIATPVPNGSERHIVLLTDGVVDVAADAAASAASRARVLGELLETLKQKSVRVHTVALSEHVDTALLNALSDATEGWREQAADATALQRAFLHMFEQASPPDTVPLKGTRFSVDGSVRELTLLVFHGADAPPLTLSDPEGRTLSAASPGLHSRWDAADGYDLVTIETPAVGEWSFSGVEDPDNRAIVVTDLSLDVDELPSSALPGETLDLGATLLEHGRPMERRDFLELTRASAILLGPAGSGDLFEMAFDPAAKGFRGALATNLPPGIYELVIRAQGATFEREVRRRLRIDDNPVTLVARAGGDPTAPRIEVELEFKPSLVEASSVTGYVLATGADGIGVAGALPALANDRAGLELPVPQGGDYTVATTLVAESASGRVLRLQVPTQTLRVEAAPAPAAEASTAAPPTAPPPSEIGYARAAALVGAGNLGLGAVLGPLWLKLRRRKPSGRRVSA